MKKLTVENSTGKPASGATDNDEKQRGKDQAYIIRKCAKILGVKPITVRRLLQKGNLPCSMLIRNLLIPAVEREHLLSVHVASSSMPEVSETPPCGNQTILEETKT